jgi:phosphatidylglycerophosphate synthase
MADLISGFFSDKYANHKAIGANVLLLLMYRFSYPFSFVLYRLGFSPNQITTLSTFSAILAATFLILGYHEIWFLVFWSGSILLDFCDGTVARMSNNISKTAFRYDHMSDIFKIFIIMLATGVYYNSLLIWLSSMTACFFFMYFMLLNHELSNITKLLERKKNKSQEQQFKSAATPSKGIFKLVKTLISNDFILKFLRIVYIALTTINGHTLLLFLMMPFNQKLAACSFFYLTTLSILGVISRISALRKIPKQ